LLSGLKNMILEGVEGLLNSRKATLFVIILSGQSKSVESLGDYS
jgi:hypothetical protein